MSDEKTWARTTYVAPRKTPDVDARTSMRYLGITILYLTFGPPIAVILWQIAFLPWP